MKKLIQNEEHLQAAQMEANKAREDFFKSQDKKAQTNIKFVEGVARNLEKKDLPFILFVNPFGYRFDFGTKIGYWSFHKMHKGKDPYSEGYRERYRSTANAFLSASIGFLLNISPHATITFEEGGKSSTFKNPNYQNDKGS